MVFCGLYGGLCAERGERHGVEALAEAKSVFAGIKYDACKLVLGKILRKPLQVLEVPITERRPGLDLYAEHRPVSPFDDEVYLALA